MSAFEILLNNFKSILSEVSLILVDQFVSKTRAIT